MTLWPLLYVAGVVNSVSWAYFATVNPTIGGALIGIAGTLAGVALNAWLIARHEGRMTEQIQSRRVVAARLDDERAVVVDEDRRRELAPPRADRKGTRP